MVHLACPARSRRTAPRARPALSRRAARRASSFSEPRRRRSAEGARRWSFWRRPPPSRVATRPFPSEFLPRRVALKPLRPSAAAVSPRASQRPATGLSLRARRRPPPVSCRRLCGAGGSGAGAGPSRGRRARSWAERNPPAGARGPTARGCGCGCGRCAARPGPAVRDAAAGGAWEQSAARGQRWVGTAVRGLRRPAGASLQCRRCVIVCLLTLKCWQRTWLKSYRREHWG